MEADGRQADEAEHQGRAHAAFEPIERVGPELRRQLRNARIGEARNGRGSDRQYALRRQVGLLDHLREHLGEDAGVGNRDRKDAGSRATGPRSGSAAMPKTIRAPSAGMRTEARTARSRANTSASRKPVLAPIATPSTANATVQTTLMTSMERRSGRIRPARAGASRPMDRAR